MIKITVNGSETEIEAKGSGLDLVNECLNAVCSMYNVLSECKGCELLALMFMTVLNTASFWDTVRNREAASDECKKEETV